MWELCTDEEWDAYSDNVGLNVFFNLAFIRNVAESYSLRVEKFIYKKKTQIIGIGAVYIDRSRVVQPDWFIETPIYVNKNRGEEIYLEAYDTLLAFLKNKFSSIQIRLPLECDDIRPFIWSNYYVSIRYTHLKNGILNSGYHKSIGKKLSKYQNTNKFSITVSDYSEEGFYLIQKFQQKFGVSGKLLRKSQKFYYSQKGTERIKFFDVYDKDNNRVICSRIALLDIENKKIYFLMISDVASKEKNVHTYLHDYVLNWALINGIEKVDFCGANIKSISIFKSYFGTELKSYYVVSYTHWTYKIIIFLKRILRL